MGVQERVLGGELGWEEFRWAVAAVMTRQNKIPMPSGSDAYALIPFWDMANHEPGGAITTHFDPERQALVCHAKRAYAAEEQVFIHYGSRSSADYLMYSGFVPDSIPDDVVRLPIGLSTGDALYAAKALLLAHLDIPVAEGRVLHASGSLEWETLVFLRVWAMDEAGLAAVDQATDAALLLGSPQGVSEANERAWTAMLGARLNLLLGRSDDAGQGQPRASKHAALARAMVDSERRILQTTAEVIQAIAVTQ